MELIPAHEHSSDVDYCEKAHPFSQPPVKEVHVLVGESEKELEGLVFGCEEVPPGQVFDEKEACAVADEVSLEGGKPTLKRRQKPCNMKRARTRRVVEFSERALWMMGKGAGW
jgi:hypothetical protein